MAEKIKIHDVTCSCGSKDIYTTETLRRTGGPRVPGKLISYVYRLYIHYCNVCQNIWDGDKIN